MLECMYVNLKRFAAYLLLIRVTSRNDIIAKYFHLGLESLKPSPLFALIFVCLTYVSHRDFHFLMASSLGTPNVSAISLHFASL